MRVTFIVVTRFGLYTCILFFSGAATYLLLLNELGISSSLNLNLTDSRGCSANAELTWDARPSREKAWYGGASCQQPTLCNLYL